MVNKYFLCEKSENEFNLALTKLIQSLLKIEQAKIIPPENIMKYSHGTRWVTTASDKPSEESEMKVHSSELLIKMLDVRNHKLSILPDLIKKNVDLMIDSFKKTMYQTILTACDESGNSISSTDYTDSAEVFLATLKTLEFGVDKNGNVSLPEYHCGSQEAIQKLDNDIKSKGQVFMDKINETIKEKSQSALDRESQRISRFEIE